MTLAFHLVMALLFYGLAGGALIGCIYHLRHHDHPEAAVDGAFTLLMAAAAALVLAQVLP